MKLPVLRVFNLNNIVLMILVLIQFYFLRALNPWFEAVLPPFTSIAFVLDGMIGQTPLFIIPYLSVYLLFALVMVLIISSSEILNMTKFLISVLLLWSLLNFLQAFLPIGNWSPKVTGSGFITDYLSQLTRPYRTLPRWHAATGVLCAIVYSKMNFKYPKIVIAWGTLICLSPIFLKMTFILETLLIVPLPFLCYFIAGKISSERTSTETIHEVKKVFTLESLLQSAAIGIRDESTLSSLIDSLTRIEKFLKDDDKKEVENAGMKLNPPVHSLKSAINKLIMSINVENQIDNVKKLKRDNAYIPTDKDIKQVTEELVNDACRPFEDPGFREMIIRIKKKNTRSIDISSIEDAAKDRSMNIIDKFKMFIETHEQDIPALRSILNNNNGKVKYSLEDIKTISSELRKPPYELSADEIWNAFHRIDKENVKPVKEFRTPANIILLTQYAAGKIKMLEPFSDKVDKKFNDWIREKESGGRKFSDEEIDWLLSMKKHISLFLEIKAESFDEEPFTDKGGTKAVYNIFGQELNDIISDLNENLI